MTSVEGVPIRAFLFLLPSFLAYPAATRLQYSQTWLSCSLIHHLKSLAITSLQWTSLRSRSIFHFASRSRLSRLVMADGFSIAGSAVGVLSLAITTCQGVLSYYSSWEHQDQNISDATGKIERLRSSLTALEEILPKISSSSTIAANVEQCILSCKEGTWRLEQFLGKCRKNPAPLSRIDKFRDCRQKAVFPFRQSSLDSLKEIVQDLEHNLSTALQVLHL